MVYIIWSGLSVIALVAILFVIKKPNNRKIAAKIVYLGSIVPSAFFLSKHFFESNYLYQILMSLALIFFAPLLVYVFKSIFRKTT